MNEVGPESDPVAADPDSPPVHLRPSTVMMVAAGGFAGTLCRYGLERFVPAHSGDWPWGTFVANMIGALILGMAISALVESGPDDGWRRQARLLIGAGFCGSLTTYSAFALEVDRLIADGRPVVAIGYSVGTVVLGLAVGAAGWALGSAVVQHILRKSES